jgi:hypothetical protein
VAFKEHCDNLDGAYSNDVARLRCSQTRYRTAQVNGTFAALRASRTFWRCVWLLVMQLMYIVIAYRTAAYWPPTLLGGLIGLLWHKGACLLFVVFNTKLFLCLVIEARRIYFRDTLGKAAVLAHRQEARQHSELAVRYYDAKQALLKAYRREVALVFVQHGTMDRKEAVPDMRSLWIGSSVWVLVWRAFNAARNTYWDFEDMLFSIEEA